MLTPLKTLARDVTADRKKHLASGAECLRQLKAAMDVLEKVKRVNGDQPSVLSGKGLML